MLDGTTADGALRRAVEIARELDRRDAQSRLAHLFPDATHSWRGETYHARALYPAHMEFFGATARYREAAVMAANRCVTPWTWLDGPSGARLSADMWTSPDAAVLSWDGEQRCIARPVGGILLGIEPAFRVVLGSGRFFDCNHRHRVLTSLGWLSLSRLVSLSNGLRCWHKLSDYQANCDEGGYLGDRPLQGVAGIDLAQFRPQADARQRAPFVFGLEDAEEPTLQHIHACQRYARFSSRDDLARHAGLFACLSGPSSASPVLSPNDCILDAVQSVLASAHRRTMIEYCPEGHEAEHSHEGLLTEAHDAACKQIACSGSRLSVEQFPQLERLLGSIEQWLHDGRRAAIFYPLMHPGLVGGERIAAIVPLGLQPIIDAHVPVWNNYFAGGVVHHNTGKTLASCYAMALFLTGQYPEWWPGRRFPGPVSAWAAGKTNETTRDILQATMLGMVTGAKSDKGLSGTGTVPGDAIGSITWRQGVADLVDTVQVRHVSGGWSTLGLKSYQQGRGSFEGTAKHVIALDEEPEADIYTECLTRTATVDGLIMATFTPLEGLSDVALMFMPGAAD